MSPHLVLQVTVTAPQSKTTLCCSPQGLPQHTGQSPFWRPTGLRLNSIQLGKCVESLIFPICVFPFPNHRARSHMGAWEKPRSFICLLPSRPHPVLMHRRATQWIFMSAFLSGASHTNVPPKTADTWHFCITGNRRTVNSLYLSLNTKQLPHYDNFSPFNCCSFQLP